MTQVGLYAIGTSTTLESNKSQMGKLNDPAYCRMDVYEKPPRTSWGLLGGLSSGIAAILPSHSLSYTPRAALGLPLAKEKTVSVMPRGHYGERCT
jgi:hypothetical protein